MQVGCSKLLVGDDYKKPAYFLVCLTQSFHDTNYTSTLFDENGMFIIIMRLYGSHHEGSGLLCHATYAPSFVCIGILGYHS